MSGHTGATQTPQSPREPIGLRNCYAFFLPLVLMTELNMISKSVIHAFLARLDAPDIALAAFNTSFAFYYTIASVTEITAIVCISYLDSRRTLRHLAGFMLLLVSGPLVVSLLVALTPAGDWLYGTVFGASDAAVVQARESTWMLCLSAPVLIVRGAAFALLMMHRRTLFITGCTLIRVASLAGSLLLWPLVLDGAAIGVAALVTCMLFETVFALVFAAPHLRALGPRAESLPGYRALWRFSWPLMLNQTSEIGTVVVANLFIGRLDRADLALASFGVVHGLVSLLFSPMRNLVQTSQTLVATRADARVLRNFTLQLAAVFAAVALLLFDTPLAARVLHGVMGLSPELGAYSAPAVLFAFLMAPFWALSALFRGLLANVRSTRLMGLTAALRLGVVALVGASVLVDDTVNGAVVGLAGSILAYAVETGVLGLRLRASSPSVPASAHR